jgi:3-oxoadipate enol-lactonase
MAEGQPQLPVHLRVFGPAQAPPVLLLHGLGSSGADWAFQIGALQRDYRLLVPDLPGVGRSPAPPHHSIPLYADALLQALDALAIERCHLVGFSMGGAVALELALGSPARVASLCTINALPSYRADTLRKRLELHAPLAMVRLFGLAPMARLASRRLFPYPHQQAMRDRVLAVMGGHDRALYLAQCQALAGWCAAARCGSLAVPGLMLAAEHDYTPLEEKRRWAEAMRMQLRVVAGSRHGTPFDAIAATNGALRAFLSGDAVSEALTIDAPGDTPTAPPQVLAAFE